MVGWEGCGGLGGLVRGGGMVERRVWVTLGTVWMGYLVFHGPRHCRNFGCPPEHCRNYSHHLPHLTKRERNTDRQMDRQTDRQADGQTVTCGEYADLLSSGSCEIGSSIESSDWLFSSSARSDWFFRVLSDPLLITVAERLRASSTNDSLSTKTKQQ